MVGSETPKIRETSLRSIPRSQAASILSLRSFEYGFMTRVSHTDQPSRNPLSERYTQKQQATVSKEICLDKLILQHPATPRNGCRRIVAPEGAGSSPVGHPPTSRIGIPNRHIAEQSRYRH